MKSIIILAAALVASTQARLISSRVYTTPSSSPSSVSYSLVGTGGNTSTKIRSTLPPYPILHPHNATSTTTISPSPTTTVPSTTSAVTTSISINSNSNTIIPTEPVTVTVTETTTISNSICSGVSSTVPIGPSGSTLILTSTSTGTSTTTIPTTSSVIGETTTWTTSTTSTTTSSSPSGHPTGPKNGTSYAWARYPYPPPSRPSSNVADFESSVPTPSIRPGSGAPRYASGAEVTSTANALLAVIAVVAIAMVV